MSCPRRVREAFALFDQDGDGVVSGTEILYIVRSCGVIPTADDIHSLPNTMTWTEFESWMAKKLAKIDPEQELLKAFAKLDRNHDGTIGTEELAQVLRAMTEVLTEMEIEQLIKEADPNNSGCIKYATLVKKLVN